MALFGDWCNFDQEDDGDKRLSKLTEKPGARETVRAQIIETVRSHYDDLARIADDVKALGYEGASAILQESLPHTKRARSGDLGEILGTELVEERVGFQVPVRRLRYKDGREMALRGDDFLGVAIDDEDAIRLLKGESKSRRKLSKKVIAQPAASFGSSSMALLKSAMARSCSFLSS